MNTRKTQRHDDYVNVLDLLGQNKRLNNKTRKITELNKTITEKKNNLEKENELLKQQLKELTLTLQSQQNTRRVKSKTRSSSSRKNKSSTKIANVDKKYHKYLKMTKMGVPIMRVRQAMQLDGVEQPPFSLDKLTKKDIDTILEQHVNSKSSPKSSPKSMFKLNKTNVTKKASPLNRFNVKKEFDKLKEKIDGYAHEEEILNFVGFENEARTNDKKMEHINIVLELIESGKINADMNKIKILNAINTASKKIIGLK
jgi:hypothetical protein